MGKKSNRDVGFSVMDSKRKVSGLKMGLVELITASSSKDDVPEKDNIKEDNIEDDNIKDDNIEDDNIEEDNIEEDKIERKIKKITR